MLKGAGLNRRQRYIGDIAAVLTFAPLAHPDVVASQRFEVPGLVIVWSADEDGVAPIVGDFIVENSGLDDDDLIGDDLFTVVTGSLTSTADLEIGGFPLNIEGSPSGEFNTDDPDFGGDGDGSLDAGDNLSPFVLDADVEITNATSQTSFYVASNRSFSINAEVIGTELDPNFEGFSNALLDFVNIEMEVAPLGADGVSSTDGGFSFGASAQPPHSGGEQAGFNSPLDFRDLEDNGPLLIFEGNQRTAQSPGSIADQSVRFDIDYVIAGATVVGYDLSLGVVDIEATVVYTVFIP